MFTNLDSFMATEVMDWTAWKHEAYPTDLWLNEKLHSIINISDWHPTENIAQAIRCVRKYCVRKMLIMDVRFYPEGNDFNVMLTGHNGREACITHFKLEAAICRAIKCSIDKRDEVLENVEG